MEKEQKQELGWRVSVLYYPFLHSTVHCVHATHNGSQWWNAGIGNTDTLHPNSCFCSFSIPTSENKIFVTSLYSFYAHAHETTPTSGYKLSHTHIVVEEGVGCVCFGLTLYLSCLLLKF